MSNNNTASRRDFLKSTTAAAAGLALAGGLSIARSAHAAENSELKIALIGCGGRGTGAAVNCLDSVENVKLIAVADAFADRAKSCAADLKKKYGDRIDLPEERVFVGFDAYEKAIAAGADVVLIATSPGFRPIHYAAAIAAGKHVFMEKPCCIDAPGFRSLLETNKLADEKNLKVVVGLQRRYQASYLNGIKKIHDGEIGDVILCQAYWNGGEPWFRDRTPEMTEMEYQMRNWYHFVWLCGDNICEQHVHNLDVCNWVKNAHPKEANGMGVACSATRTATPRRARARSTTATSSSSPTPTTARCTASAARSPTPGTACRRRCSAPRATRPASPAATARNPYEQEHIELFKAIRKDEKHNDGHYGATSSFTAVLGRMANYSGQVVTWDDAAAKGPSEMPEKYAFDANPRAMPDKDGLYPIAVPGIYKPY